MTEKVYFCESSAPTRHIPEISPCHTDIFRVAHGSSFMKQDKNSRALSHLHMFSAAVVCSDAHGGPGWRARGAP